jgi:Glycosyl transferase 4-like
MKILIATSLAGSWPYIPEMLEEFRNRGHHVEVFDITDCRPRGIASRLAFKIPKLQYRTTVAVLKERLTEFALDFDAVNIHYADPIYSYLVASLKRRGKRLVTSIWGSDFLRASSSALHNLGLTFAASDVVTSNNPEIMEKIVAHYPSISERARIVPFGLGSLDVITKLQRSESFEESRRKFAIPPGKLAVTCGYNAIREQCHSLMIDALSRLSDSIKSRFFVLLPMTYPDNPEYRAEIKNAIQATGIEFRILEERMSPDDVARLRIVSDYAVNMQTTDSLSASIQEHLFAGSSVIVANWLPYGVLEQMGIQLQRVDDAAGICAILENAPLSCGTRGVTPKYAERIYDYSSWSSNAPRWLGLYGGDRDRLSELHRKPPDVSHGSRRGVGGAPRSCSRVARTP